MIPFMAWPIEYFIGMPFLVEEVLKALLVGLMPRMALPRTIAIVITSGILFAFTESIFYLFQIQESSEYLQRLALTIPLHVITWLLIAGVAHHNRKLLPIGLGLAITLHYFYNQFIILLPTN